MRNGADGRWAGVLLQDLTIPLHAGEHAAVQGSVLGASEDGSSVFVVAQGLLAENENAAGETAQPGQENLYELHYEGTQWTRTFIAVLSGEDSPDWDEGANVSDENTRFSDGACLAERGIPGVHVRIAASPGMTTKTSPANIPVKGSIRRSTCMTRARRV